MQQRLSLFSFVVLIALSVICVDHARAVEGPSAKSSSSAITFNRDIAPLVFKNCAVCHRPGEVAPFLLLSYSDVRKHAKQIVQMTSTRQMPPWKPVGETGTFLGERSLNDSQIAMLAKWVAEGSAEGNAKDLPPLPQFAAGWLLGEPDLVVTMPKAYQLAAEGRDIYRNFVIPVEMPAGKYIRAVEYRPSNRRVVHHAIISWDTARKSRELDGKDGAPGYTSVAVGGTLLPGSPGFWVPGKLPMPLPEGASLAWPCGADLLLQLHLHPSGKVEEEQSKIGFFFTNEPPSRSLRMMMLMAPVSSIPAGEKAWRSRAEKTLDRDSQVVGIFPHMHLIGKDTKITARLPDGASKILLQIDQWDFNWQGYYEYAAPVTLPRGTVVVMESTHDNSDSNLANPNHPPRPVSGGEQTTNEMSAVVLHMTSNQPGGGGGGASAAMTTAATRPAAAADLEKANSAIGTFDKDGDGKLSGAEIALIPSASANDVPAIFKRFDRDADGKLSAAELAEAIATLKQR